MRATRERRGMAATDDPDLAPISGLRVLLVDDHALIRSALRLLLESRFEQSVEEAGCAADALALIEEVEFDVVLLDVHMPENDGLWTLLEIQRRKPSLPVVMLSYEADEYTVRSTLEAGACGYLVKGASIEQVTDALSVAVTAEGVYLHPVAAATMVPGRSEATIEPLTSRELDVLALVVQGEKNEEIADQLFITEKTVKTHLSGVFRKLGVTNRTQAATTAIREGLLRPSVQ